MAAINHHPPPPPLPETPHSPTHRHRQPSNIIPSSSPAFATPLHPIRPEQLQNAPADAQITTSTRSASVLPILLPPATLRPVAFRTFTKKHNLNITMPALQALATFIGKHCGAAWREDGLAEPVLEEIAKSWKRLQPSTIVDGGQGLKAILKQLEGTMSGGKIISGKASLSRQTSWAENDAVCLGTSLQRRESLGMNALDVDEIDDEELRLSEQSDPRSWLKVVNAFEQPRFSYSPATKHFEKSKYQASFFPTASQKTELFRQRYHLIHQRVLRNESFQAPHAANSERQQWRITPISNLLGRNGTGHLLLGLLTITPTGTLAISDLTGSIHLDLEQATTIDLVDAWVCPGMIVLVDGVYEEQHHASGAGLGNFGGIGGTIGGRFLGFSIGAPRCETRAATLGIVDPHSGHNSLDIGGAFGWIDFLGLGSEKAVGSRMRKIEQRLLSKQSQDQTNSSKIVFLGDCNLDNPQTLSALRRVFQLYSPKPDSLSTSGPMIPLAFVLYGSFATYAAMSSTASYSTSSSAANGSSTSATAASIPDSILYKESFDSLALLLTDFPVLLRHSTWIFVPGDNDAWPSSFSAGASTPLPRQAVPEMFTSRVRRAFNTANSNIGNSDGVIHESSGAKKPKGEVIFTSNPSRLSLFGPSCEVVLFRDDISGRMRRNAIPLKTKQADEGESRDGNGTDTDVVRNVSGEPSNMNGSHETEDKVGSTDIVMSGALPSSPSSPPPHASSLTSSPPQTSTVTMQESHSSTKAVNQTTRDELSAEAHRESPNQPTKAVSTDKTQSPLQNQARSLTKALLDQHTLSPFPLNIRPLHWSFAQSALSLYPLPSCLVLSDAGMDAWCVRYQSVEVLNTGRLCSSSSVSAPSGEGVGDEATTVNLGGSKRKGTINSGSGTNQKQPCTWVEFDVSTRRGSVRSA